MQIIRAVQPPSGYGIIWNPDALTTAGDLKWCPKHEQWEAVDPAPYCKVDGYWLVARRAEKS